MKEPRLAAIDIGSNSIRCIVVEVDIRGKFKVLDDEEAAELAALSVFHNFNISGKRYAIVDIGGRSM